MTRPNSAFVLRRTSERLSAGAAAIAATFLMVLAVDVRAAEPEGTPRRITVSYQDTAFATKAGTTNVYRKLKLAAHKVCGIAPGIGRLTLAQHIQAQECVDVALADAVQRINRPMLTSVHESSARDLG
ncbi:MAG TPA: UrcA family protein [Steroidobacteraceae bacterium]|nr:UrcA family protein [Steroidobacteraceae bacterium]